MLPNVSIKYQGFSKKGTKCPEWSVLLEPVSSEPDFIPAFLFAALDK